MSNDTEKAGWIAARDAAAGLHAPVLLAEVRAALDAGRGGVFIDGTFGAGGYARALLEDGAAQVIGVDRDPEAIRRAEAWAPLYDGRLTLVEGRFAELDAIAKAHATGPVMGVALDLGVSSMQLDQAERGFSFMRDGPLDMRMGQGGAEEGESVAELVARADEALLADILFHLGDERAARRIARSIVRARAEEPIETTLRLAEIIERSLPRPKPGQPHAATRSFQALRIAVNDELGELAQGLAGAERALAPGGMLAVVSFHSLEDRMVKRFLNERSAKTGGGSRYEPEVNLSERSFEPIGRGATGPGEDEIARNPRSRSAKLRAARRLDAPAHAVDAASLGALDILKPGRPGRRPARKERR